MEDFNFKKEISDRVSRLESDVANIKEDVKSLDGIHNSITKISTLLEIQQEVEKEDKEERKRQNEALTELSKANVKTTSILEKLESKIESLNKKIDEIYKESNISIFSILQKAAPFLLGGGILYTILKTVGKI